MNDYKHLGIPDNKFYLLHYKNVYDLENDYHNFFIIFTNDTQIQFMTSEYRNGYSKKKKYISKLRYYLNDAYGLKFGNQLHKYIRKAIERE